MQKTTATTVSDYNKLQSQAASEICNLLEININKYLKNNESKIWHGSPVWFINGNPVVAYSVRKDGRVSLMFFSGQSFNDEDLKPEGKFKAAEIFYSSRDEVETGKLKKWLGLAIDIQWDYKNIVKNKGVLVSLPAMSRKENICSRGHVYAKSKDIPTCPTCWPGRYNHNESKT